MCDLSGTSAAALAGPPPFSGAVSGRLASGADHPVAGTGSSNITPTVFSEALGYSVACFLIFPSGHSETMSYEPSKRTVAIRLGPTFRDPVLTSPAAKVRKSGNNVTTLKGEK